MLAKKSNLFNGDTKWYEKVQADIEQERLDAEEASKLIEENRALEIQQVKDSKENWLKYQEELKVLNAGRMNFLGRGPNDSKACFLKRMKTKNMILVWIKKKQN